jgi:hypothetical protein
MIPIRMDPGLLFIAWYRRATLVLAIWAACLLPMALAVIIDFDDPKMWRLFWMSVGAWTVWLISWGLFWLLDRKNRMIRRIVGDSTTGSSDPMTFTRPWVEESTFVTAQTNYKAENYTIATENCIQIHNWWGAIFAARMVERFEDPELGREFVDRILNDPEVQESLAEVEKDHSQWEALLGPGRYTKKSRRSRA